MCNTWFVWNNGYFCNDGLFKYDFSKKKCDCAGDILAAATKAVQLWTMNVIFEILEMTTELNEGNALHHLYNC